MKLTEAEWKIMNAVWDRSPASVRDVLDAVGNGTGWAYTTVKTMMNRLVEKGVLKVRTRANTNLYDPLASHEEALRVEVSTLADRAFDGMFGPLVHFLLSERKLSKKDRAELRQMLDDLEAESGGGAADDRPTE